MGHIRDVFDVQVYIKSYLNENKDLNEGIKSHEEVGFIIVDEDDDNLKIEIFDDENIYAGHIWCTRFDWEEDDDYYNDQSFDCDDKDEFKDVWVVTSVAATDIGSGYGPLLYDLALEWVTSQLGGVMMSGGHGETTGTVKPAAAKVWQYYFNNRNDVGRRQIPGCSDVLSKWVLDDDKLKSYHEALKYVYTKDWDILADLDFDDKIKQVGVTPDEEIKRLENSD